jgi:hypothetical protein
LNLLNFDTIMTALGVNGDTVPRIRQCASKCDSDSVLIDVLVEQMTRELPLHRPADIALWRIGLLRYAQQSLKVSSFHVDLLDWEHETGEVLIDARQAIGADRSPSRPLINVSTIAASFFARDETSSIKIQAPFAGNILP